MILGERHMECAYYFDFCRLCLVNASEKQRERGSCRAGGESEAPAELAPPWFGRSLTLPYAIELS